MYTIEELESIVSEGSNAVDITDIVDQLLDTMREAARYRAALEWYADGSNYRRAITEFACAVIDDDGQRARDALKGDE